MKQNTRQWSRICFKKMKKLIKQTGFFFVINQPPSEALPIKTMYINIGEYKSGLDIFNLGLECSQMTRNSVPVITRII